MADTINTEKLIATVQQYPILYDLSHPDYKNIRKKGKVWDGIGVELEKSGEDMKKKWRNIRHTYAKYLKSTQTKTGQAAKKNYKHWQWASHMEFLRPFLAFAQTDSNIRDTVGDTNATDEVIENTAFDGNEEENEKSENSDELPEAPVVTTPSQPSQKASQEKRTATTSSQPSQKASQEKKTRKFLSYTTDGKTDSPMSGVLQYLQSKPRQVEKTANELIFAGYAKTISSFSPRRQAITRLKISQIIADQELLHIEETSRPSSALSASNTTTPLSVALPAYSSATTVMSSSCENSNYSNLGYIEQQPFEQGCLSPVQTYISCFDSDNRQF